ncbi:MAG: hypothetical protein WAL13_30010, partial [Trebonia sp.]
RRETIMNRIRHIHRYVAVPAGLAFAWLGLAAAAPAAFAASAVIPVGDDGGTAAAPAAQTVPQVVVVGGMPGWQIALIAIGAALVAATVAVVLDRALAARKVHATTA